MTRRLWTISAALALALVLLAPSGPARTDSSNFFRIATGPTVATYFPIGGLLAGAISRPPGGRDCEDGGSCGVEGLIAVAHSSGGARQNLDLIAQGEVESALSQADLAHWAHTGSGVFEASGANEKLRLIANLYTEAVQIVVRRDSGIKNPADLRGRRVSYGPAESGAVSHSRLILSAYGVNEDDVIREYSSQAEAGEHLRQGKVEAMIVIGGHPVPVITALARDGLVDLLAIDGAPAGALIERNPFLHALEIPAQIYPGIPARRTLAVEAQWLTSSDVDEALVYAITRALWHRGNRGLLDGGHPKGREIRLERALNGNSVPLHPGARRFYREAGALK